MQLGDQSWREYAIILIIAFLPFSSFPNNSIADQICNAYKNTDDRSKCFDELKEEPRYLSFKFGVSACPNKKKSKLI